MSLSKRRTRGWAGEKSSGGVRKTWRASELGKAEQEELRVEEAMLLVAKTVKETAKVSEWEPEAAGLQSL